MHATLKRMNHVLQNREAVLADLKAQGQKKMIGYFFPVFPEEILYAAGIHPVQLYPDLQDGITMADHHLQLYLCAYLRAQWDQVLKGKLDFLDGVIIPRSCEAVTFLYQTWKRHNPFDFIDYINIPWKKSANTQWFFEKELHRVKGNLEEFTGRDITEDALTNAVRVYNQNRRLLKKVFDLAAHPHPPFSHGDVFTILMSGFVLDKGEHNQMLTGLLNDGGETADSSDAEAPVRLLLSGGCVLDTRLLEMITASGAAVVANDFNNGERSFQTLVPEGTDPIKAMAKAYMASPCAFNTSIEDRFSFMGDLIEKRRVNGVLFAVNRNCETEKFDYPLLDQKIRERFHIPTMLMETDYQCAMAPLQTRVEAFVEMIGSKET